MTKEQKEELKNVINQTIKTVGEEIERLGEKVAPISPDVSLGRLTRQEALQEKSINESILRKAKARLKRLIYASQKVDEPSFGQCTDVMNQFLMKG
jgi:DnaK suppressor protein